MTPEERHQLISDIAEALKPNPPSIELSEDEIRALKLLIKRQERSIELRRAIIEKSLTGLIWSAIVFVGYMIKEWLTLHGFK